MKVNDQCVVANFICQIGWAMVPKYLVQHYSGCFYEVFWMRFTFYLGLLVKYIAHYNVGGPYPIS